MTPPLHPIFLFAFYCFQLTANCLQAQTWERVGELPAGEMTAMFSQGDTLYAGGVNKIYYTYDGGAGWDSSAVVHPLVDFIEAVHYIQGHLFVGTVLDGVFRSDNGGQTWSPDNAGLSGLGALSISGFASRGDSLYVATYGAGVFVKNIATNSFWSPYNAGIPWGNIESLHHIDGVLFAGSGGNATLSRQTYPSQVWEEIPFDNFNGEINGLLSLVKQDDVLLAVGMQGLYRSTDGGDTWAWQNTGVGFVSNASLVVSGNRVIARLTRSSGLTFHKYTTDQGQSWHNFEPALTGSIGYDIAICGGRLFAARSNGLWRITLITADEEPAPQWAALGQNYPNPFRGQTTIPVSLATGGFVNLSLYDAAGSLVRTLWRGEQSAGNYQLTLDMGNLPAGVYSYRLMTAAGAQTKWLVVAE
ncbi:MAG: T9SS type A sorting domain-containing protein [Saprospiraceae bacterium]|nr:T9SS type A sorting domain-containing protein [Saprospiraceae bacterium]